MYRGPKGVFFVGGKISWSREECKIFGKGFYSFADRPRRISEIALAENPSSCIPPSFLHASVYILRQVQKNLGSPKRGKNTRVLLLPNTDQIPLPPVFFAKKDGVGLQTHLLRI